MKLFPRSTSVAAAAVLVLAAGCGGDDPADSDFAKQTGEDIAAAAKADMKALDQVKYAGEITSDGSTIRLDIQASSAGDCTGSIGIQDGNAEVRTKDGTSWFRPDEAFWRANGGDQADAIIAAVGDKWVLDTQGSFTQFCDLDAFFDGIFTSDGEDDGKYERVGTDELDGEDVVKVEKTDSDGAATGYVLIEGEHYLLKLERIEGEDPGAIEFSDFNEEFDVEAPAEDEVVDLDQL